VFPRLIEALPPNVGQGSAGHVDSHRGGPLPTAGARPFVSKALEKPFTHRVLILADPAENGALSRFFHYGRTYVIVLDPQMKGLDSLELLKQPGEQTTHETVEVLKAGVFAYLPTPCDLPRFEHIVALALSNAVNTGSA
jgi:DNA-binding NtrC family response regulator